MAIYQDIVKKIPISAEKKTKQKQYLSSGVLPIIDQGQQIIGGYTDDISKKIDCDLPVIVFGDHTRCVKLIKFAFAPGADGIKVVRPVDNSVLIEYLFYATKYLATKIRDKGYARHYQDVEKQELEIPTVLKQKEIVLKLEKDLSSLDNAVKTLNKTKEQLTVYRQAVLKYVFETVYDAEEMQVNDICKEIKVGIVIKPSRFYTTKDNGVKAFRSANVREFHIDDFDWVYLSEEGQKENQRSVVHTGDVLIVRSGYPGTACVVSEKFDGCNAIDVLIAVPNQEIVLPEYLCAFTNSPKGKEFVEEKKRGVGQKHFNVGGYKKMIIPIPSMEEQKRIVSMIDERLSVCNKIYEIVEQELIQAEAMRQSILKEVFEGRL